MGEFVSRTEGSNTKASGAGIRSPGFFHRSVSDLCGNCDQGM